MTAEILTTTTFTNALKTIFDRKRLMFELYRDSPAYANLVKHEDFFGENFVLSVAYGRGGRSNYFENAQGNALAPRAVKFTLTRSKDYSIGYIENEALKAAKNDAGAFAEALQAQQQICLATMKHMLCYQTFRIGDGCIGSISNSTFSTAVATLNNAEDAINFYPGQVLVAADDNASAVRSGTLTVSSVDLSAGTVTMTGTLVAGVAAIAQNDYLFNQGDYRAASNRNLMKGFDAWNPVTAPTTGDSFFGANRSVDPVWFGGHRRKQSVAGNLTTLEAISYLATDIMKLQKRADTCYLHPDRMRDLITELGDKIVYTVTPAGINNSRGEKIAEVNFTGVKVLTGGGAIDVLADAYCPANTLYVQRKGSWHLKSLGMCPEWVVPQNVVYNADQIEMRLAHYSQIYCDEPGANGRFDWGI
jgi:hypothetical protein